MRGGERAIDPSLAEIALFVLHRGVVQTLLVAGAIGSLAVVLGAPAPH